MIIKPGELRFGIKAGSYPVITTPDDFIEYSKGRKEDFIVELSGSMLPLADLVAGARVFEVDAEKKQFRPRRGQTRLKRIKGFRERREIEREEKERVLGRTEG